MPENFSLWLEIGFDIAYLITIWVLVYLMLSRRQSVHPENRAIARLIRWMFILLAIGDTGHVGFRVLAYLKGPLENSSVLVGMGSLATAITITFFYMIFVEVYRNRFKKQHNWFTWLLIVIGVVRLVIMALPGNQWGQLHPPQSMSILRNIPLIMQGIGILGLILWQAKKAADKTFLWVGFFVFLSYLFFTPVILFVNQIPMLGMLMIPKTLTYLAIAYIFYAHLYSINK